MASVPFNNLITFSRGSNATLVDSTGKIAYAPNNLLTFSEQFDNAYWVKQALGVAATPVVTANAGVAPDGTRTADRIQFDCVNTGSGTNRSYISPAISYPTGVNYAGSVWVKAFDVGNVGRTIRLAVDGVANAVFTLTADWQRIVVAGLASSTVTNFIIETRGTFTTQTADVLVWGAQLELGSAATTYNSTTVKNLLGFSEAFDNAAWTKTRTSIVTGAQANPVNGAFNAQKLMEDTTASATHPVSAGITFTAIPYTMSIYAKAAGRNWIYLALLGTTNSFASFNLSNGTVGTIGAAATATIQDVGNGWYRCRITSTATAGAGTAAFYPASANDTISYTGDGNSGVYIYGAQLSDSASLDPYVPTPAAAPSSTAYYGPRFDYDPVTLQPKGLLVEEARTNLLLQSENFAATWTGPPTTGTLTANATTSPAGTGNATLFVPSNTAVNHDITQTLTASAVTYTLSVYAKAQLYSHLFLLYFDGTTDRSAYFNVSTGVVGTTSGTPSPTITAVGNGWYRCSITFTGVVSRNNFVVGAAPSDGGRAVAGNGTSGIFIWGAQLEAGAFATSYIPTVASTVTRSADIAQINGSLFSQWYGQSEGSWVSSFAPYVVPGGVVAQISAATNNDRFQLLADSAGQIAVSAGGAGQGTIDAGTVAAGATNNLAYAYRTNDTAASLSGGAAVADTTVTLPVVDRLCLGATVTPAGFLNGHIRSIDFIPARAADFQLQALTT